MESESWAEESDGGSFAVELKANLDEIERVSGAAGDYRGNPTFHETFDAHCCNDLIFICFLVILRPKRETERCLKKKNTGR